MVTKAVFGVIEVSVSRDFNVRRASSARSRNLLSEGGCAGCKGTEGAGAGHAGAVTGVVEPIGAPPCCAGAIPCRAGVATDCAGVADGRAGVAEGCALTGRVAGVCVGAGLAACEGCCRATLTTRGRVKAGADDSCALADDAGANTAAVKLKSRKERLFIF